LHTQVGAQRLLQHLVFVLAGASRGHLQDAQKAIVQVNGSLTSHVAILTERSISVIILGINEDQDGRSLIRCDIRY
jgi:phosphohistidine swiveling domain-containing protein